jgi:hypothetical protein
MGDVTTDDLADVLAVSSYIAITEEVVGSLSSIVGTRSGSRVSGQRSTVNRPRSIMNRYRLKLKMHGTRDRTGFLKRRSW